VHRGRMDIAEAMGTRRLFDFVHENPLVNMEPSGFVHDPEVVAQLDRFVAINSALEIDLTGQVTAESLGPRQVAGIGGQFDFVLGASRSRGGAAVIALPSTIPGFGRSYSSVLLLSGVDLLEDLLVRREPERRLVRVDDVVVDRHLEDPAVSFLERRGESVLGLDGGLQTGGLRQVVSLAAVSDLDVHPSLLPESDPHSNMTRDGRGEIP